MKSMIDTLIGYLRGPEKQTAGLAKERLQIILAHERAGRGAATPDYLPALQEELLEVIAKYIHIDRDMIKVQLEKHSEYDVLELNITLPDGKDVPAPVSMGFSDPLPVRAPTSRGPARPALSPAPRKGGRPGR